MPVSMHDWVTLVHKQHQIEGLVITYIDPLFGVLEVHGHSRPYAFTRQPLAFLWREDLGTRSLFQSYNLGDYP